MSQVINVAKTKEELEEKVAEIKQKVSEHQGEIALSFREIITCRNDFSFPSSDYLETGVIDGEFVEDTPKIPQWIEIDYIIRDSRHFLPNYIFYPDLSIPVERKLTSRRRIIFSPEQLKKSERGMINFSSSEILEKREIPGYQKSTPYLHSLFVLVGDGEVGEFLTEKRGRADLEDFFRLMKKPGEIEKRIVDYDFEQRENLTRDLVQEVARLCLLDREVEDIEEKIMKAKNSTFRDQDGSSYGTWSNAEQVGMYKRFKPPILEATKKIEEMLKRAEEIDLKSHNSVVGNYIGFPNVVGVGDYLAYAEGHVLFGVKRRLENLDSHLKEEQKKG